MPSAFHLDPKKLMSERDEPILTALMRSAGLSHGVFSDHERELVFQLIREVRVSRARFPGDRLFTWREIHDRIRDVGRRLDRAHRGELDMQAALALGDLALAMLIARAEADAEQSAKLGRRRSKGAHTEQEPLA